MINFVDRTSNGARQVTPADLNAAFAQPALFYPEDYGARADGHADDTAGVQACIFAAGSHGSVLFKRGLTYRVTGLTLPSDIHVIVDGTVLLMPGANTPVFNVPAGASRVLIDGVGVLDGNRSAQTGQGNIGGAGVNVFQASHVVIRDITIRNCYNWPVNIVTSANCLVDNVSMTACGNSAEIAAQSTDSWFTNCAVSHIDDIGISFYGGVGRSGATGCDVSFCAADGINVLSDAAQAQPCGDILIEGNVSWSNQGGAFSVTRGQGGTGTHYDIIISGNRGFNNRLQGGFAGAGVYVTNGYNILIDGNSFGPDGTAGGSCGIYLDGVNGISYTTIQGNVIRDQGQGGQTPNSIGIFCSGTENATIIRGNRISDTRSPAQLLIGFGGTAGPNCWITDNTVMGAAGAVSTMNVTTNPTVVRNAGMAWNFGDGLNVSGGALNVVGGAANIALGNSGNAATVTTFGNATDIGINYSLKGNGKHRYSNPLVLTGATLNNGYANDAAASAGGVEAGQVYRDTTGALRIHL